jgi:hypothetical protein
VVVVLEGSQVVDFEVWGGVRRRRMREGERRVKSAWLDEILGIKQNYLFGIPSWVLTAYFLEQLKN